jgi:hypothetical protein
MLKKFRFLREIVESCCSSSLADRAAPELHACLGLKPITVGKLAARRAQASAAASQKAGSSPSIFACCWQNASMAR